MRVCEIEELADILDEIRDSGSRIGLVCGCFDILHLGHIELFRFARKHVDVLVVGMDTDRSIRKSKGAGRPIHDLTTRLEQIIELRSVDYAFPIEGEMTFGASDSFSVWRNMLSAIRPHAIISNGEADQYCAAKQKLARESGIQMIVQPRKRQFSSSRVEQLYLESL